MKRFALAAIALAALAAPASAENLNCEKDFKAFWERMSGNGAKLSGKELADINRVAVRGFDACTSGDERFNAKNFFEKISQYGSKPEDIFKSVNGYGAKN